MQTENIVLQQKLNDSNAEVGRLRDHLAQAKRDATTDALTSLANRKAFDDELQRACTAADMSGVPLHLAVLDIDHFKIFNDTWGHQTGDQVLRYVAGVIGRVGAPPRFAARYGGEEFAMIFSTENSDRGGRRPARDLPGDRLAAAEASLHQRGAGRRHHLRRLRPAPRRPSRPPR